MGEFARVFTDKRIVVVSLIILLLNGLMFFDSAKYETPQEKEIIDKAKKIIMNQRYYSESDAYKYIRTKSMNCGVKLIETAKQICRDNPGKE